MDHSVILNKNPTGNYINFFLNFDSYPDRRNRHLKKNVLCLHLILVLLAAPLSAQETMGSAIAQLKKQVGVKALKPLVALFLMVRSLPVRKCLAGCGGQAIVDVLF